MTIVNYSFFHRETNDTTEGGQVSIPMDSSLWPPQWTSVEYKHYALCEEISLPKHEGSPLLDVLKKRTSDIDALLANEVTLSSLSSMLFAAFGQIIREGKPHRMAPSGGARYPLEGYVYLFKDIDGASSGVYHYNIENHSLETILKKNFTEDDISLLQAYPWVKNTTGFLAVTAVFNRTIRKYGSRGYRYILLEAGHVAQNFILSGVEVGVVVRPMGGTREGLISEDIACVDADEGVVYALHF